MNRTYHAAPIILNPITMAVPNDAHIYGDVSIKNPPTSNHDDLPLNKALRPTHDAKNSAMMER
jgi:hypothetical protein